MRHFILVFTLSVSVIFQIHTQETVSINLTEKDGLPDNEIYSIIEDGSGFIWLAGNKGLFQYDGKSFKSVSNPKKRGRSFFNLKRDSKGRIWCNNIAGQFFYIENDSLKLFGDYHKLLKGRLTDFEFSNNHLVIKSESKDKSDFNLVFIDTDTKDVDMTSIKTTGTSVGVQFNNTFYYLNDKYNLTSLDYSSPKIVGSIAYSKKWFTNFHKIKEGFFITRSDKNHVNTELFFYDDKIKHIKLPYILLSVRIEHIASYQDKIYLSTNKGLYVCEIKDDTIYINNNYLNSNFISKTIQDKNKNLWVSTIDNGAFVIPNESLKIIDTGLNINVLERKNDSICYIGSDDGYLYTFNTEQNNLKRVNIELKSKVRAITFLNKSNQLLLNTADKGIIYNTLSFELEELEEQSAVKSTQFIDSNFFLISSSSGTFIKSRNTSLRLTSLRSYKSIFSKKSNCIYIADVDGLKLFNREGDFIKDITYNNNAIYAFDISETSDGTIYIVTYDKGVIVVKDGEVTNVINKSIGLASNTINTIQSDKKNIWIATEKGLQYYNPETNNIKTITKQDGINSYTIYNIEVLGDTVLLLSNLGLFSFNKTLIFKERELLNPYFTSVRIQEKNTILKDTYTLKQDESSIRFQFNTKGFQSNKFTIYQYQLKELDDNWITLDEGSNYVNFASLPAGNYTFNLRAKHKFNDLFSDIKQVKLIVTLPFQETWWFRLFLFLIVISLVLVYFITKTKRLKEQQTIELEKAEISKDLVFSQLENLRSQMNPHFIFNALNSIQDYIISNEKKLARRYLVKFSRLIRIYLDHSRTDEVSLADELHALNLYLELEKDRFDDDFKFSITVDKLLNTDTVKVPSLFIQPYVENALKHGLLHKENNKKLNLSFDKSSDEKTLICCIEDNGIGRKASAKINNKRVNYTSFATSANQKRIDLINSAKQTELSVEIIDLINKNNQPKGTKVVLKITI